MMPAAVARFRQLSLAGVLAEAIRRVSNEESISAMFRYNGQAQMHF